MEEEKSFIPPNVVIQNLSGEGKTINCIYDCNTDTVTVNLPTTVVEVGSIPVCICSKNRSEPLQELIRRIPTRNFFVFVEEDQQKKYLPILQEPNCWLLVWNKNNRGICFARDIAKAVLTEILWKTQFNHFFMIDDDLDVPVIAVLNRNVTPVSMRWEDTEWEIIFQECLSISNALDAAIVAPTSSKDLRFYNAKQVTYVSKEKPLRKTTKAQQLVLMNFRKLKNISYIPSLYRKQSDKKWDSLWKDKEQKDIQEKYFQGEDWGIAKRVKTAFIMVKFGVKEKNLPSQAGTIKQKKQRGKNKVTKKKDKQRA